MTTRENSPLTISRLAQLAGVGLETVRYYQRIGLLQTPPKPPQGYRTYPTETLQRLQFINRAKQLGFTLKEIAELLQLGPTDCQTTRQLAQQKHSDIQTKIRDLQAISKILEQLIERCDADSTDSCPILAALSRPKHD